MEVLVTITLVVKGDPDEAREQVKARLSPFLNMWFVEDVRTPYNTLQDGSLLWYGVSAIKKTLSPSER